MKYKPKDIKDIKLPDELEKIIDDIACLIHDTWAKRIIDEGWVYGPTKSDKIKTTPLLIPYDELPDSEKEYDRATAKTTIQCLIDLGYSISEDTIMGHPYIAYLIDTTGGKEWCVEVIDEPAVIGGGITKKEAITDAAKNLKAYMEYKNKK